MDTTIKYYRKSVYGRDLCYPANAKAMTITKLTGRKTFDAQDWVYINDLGFEVVEVLQSQSEIS